MRWACRSPAVGGRVPKVQGRRIPRERKTPSHAARAEGVIVLTASLAECSTTMQGVVLRGGAFDHGAARRPGSARSCADCAAAGGASRGDAGGARAATAAATRQQARCAQCRLHDMLPPPRRLWLRWLRLFHWHRQAPCLSLRLEPSLEMRLHMLQVTPFTSLFDGGTRRCRTAARCQWWTDWVGGEQ